MTLQTIPSETFAQIDRAFARGPITAPKAYAAHVAAQKQIAEISREQAEAIKTAPGYSHAMGCFLSPKAEIAFLEAQRRAPVASKKAA